MRDKFGRFLRGNKVIKPFVKGNTLRLGLEMSQEQKSKISMSNKGKKLSKEHKQKISNSHKGKKKIWMIGTRYGSFKRSVETRKRMSESHKGEKSYLWKGGVTLENQKIRGGIEYRLWREAVFARDNWTCQMCHQRGGQLDPDHIKMFAYHPELRLALDNGRTLCRKCHKGLWTSKSKKHTCCEL